MKKIIFTTLLIIWLIVIFMFSQANGTESGNTSNKVIKDVVVLVNKFKKKKITNDQLSKAYKKYSFIIRKFAHFTEYFILGILCYLCFSCYMDKSVALVSLIFCIVYASSDEFHQLFIDGRGARVLDVLIDSSGSGVALLIIKFLKMFIIK